MKLTLLAIFAGGLTGPALEGAMKRAALGKAKHVRHLADGHLRFAEIPERQVFSQIIDQLLMRCLMLTEFPLQRARTHTQLVGGGLDGRAAAVQFCSDNLARPAD